MTGRNEPMVDADKAADDIVRRLIDAGHRMQVIEAGSTAERSAAYGPTSMG
jgi:hypothetical protein